MSKKLEEHIKKTFYSIIGNNSLLLNFIDNQIGNFFIWDQNLVKNNTFLIYKPHHSENLSQYPILTCRANLDLCCCYYLFFDKEKYQQLISISQNQQLHNQFEKIRISLLGASKYQGFAKNIAQKIIEDFRSANQLDTLPVILFDEVCERIFPKNIKDELGLLKNKIDPKVTNLIVSLANFLEDQEQFFKEVEKIAKILESNKIQEEQKQESNESKLSQDQHDNLQKQIISQISKNDHKKTDSFESQINQEIKDLIANSKIATQQPKSKKISDDFDFYAGQKNNSLCTQITQEPKNIEFIRPYKIFTTKFDEVILPTKIIKKEELDKLKEQLLEKFKDLKQISKSVELKLKKKLLAKKDEFFEQSAFEGVINRKKLTQLIINPLVSNILVNKSIKDGNDVAVSILLDNSGSMRGKPIIMTTLACQILAEILEKFSIKTEIIGYTTGDWKGGRVKKMWEELGKEKNPGRLNELRHIIYKDFKHSLESRKNNLALMLKEGLLKENIDGEAIIFATKRLAQRVEKRKILLVISDGNPIDDATNSANDGDILLDHLQNVVTNLDKKKNIELASIAIGYSGNNFYKNSVAIKDVSEIGDVMLEKVLQFL